MMSLQACQHPVPREKANGRDGLPGGIYHFTHGSVASLPMSHDSFIYLGKVFN